MAVDLPIGQLVEFGDNVRRCDDTSDGHIATLAADIAAHGLLHPVTVRQTAPDRYEVVAGWRRVQAHRMLKAATVPAVVVGEAGDDAELFRISLSENMHRHPLSNRDKCVAIRRCFDESGEDIKQVCATTHLAPSTVRRYVDISNLPDDVIARLDSSGDDRLTLAEAHQLARPRNEGVPSGTTAADLPPPPPELGDDPALVGSQAPEAPASKKERKKPIKQSPWVYNPDGDAVPIPEALYASVYHMVQRHSE